MNNIYRAIMGGFLTFMAILAIVVVGLMLVSSMANAQAECPYDMTGVYGGRPIGAVPYTNYCGSCRAAVVAEDAAPWGEGTVKAFPMDVNNKVLNLLHAYQLRTYINTEGLKRNSPDPDIYTFAIANKHGQVVNTRAIIYYNIDYGPDHDHSGPHYCPGVSFTRTSVKEIRLMTQLATGEVIDKTYITSLQSAALYPVPQTKEDDGVPDWQCLTNTGYGQDLPWPR